MMVLSIASLTVEITENEVDLSIRNEEGETYAVAHLSEEMTSRLVAQLIEALAYLRDGTLPKGTVRQ